MKIARLKLATTEVVEHEVVVKLMDDVDPEKVDWGAIVEAAWAEMPSEMPPGVVFDSIHFNVDSETTSGPELVEKTIEDDDGDPVPPVAYAS